MLELDGVTLYLLHNTLFKDIQTVTPGGNGLTLKPQRVPPVVHLQRSPVRKNATDTGISYP